MKTQTIENKPPYPKWDGEWDTLEEHSKKVEAYEAKYGKQEVLMVPYWMRKKKR